MAYLINRLKQSLAQKGLTPRTNLARAWLQQKMLTLKPSRERMMEERKRLRKESIVGKMYFYFYDPKTKETMRYYDKFPLVIPIEEYADGFLGLNLHYIHPKHRMILLDKLSETTNNDKYDKTTKLRISYEYLAASTKAFEAQPCIKRYLYNHIDSRFLEISADEWDIAALLPVETFVGATTSKVYSDSRKKF